MRAAIADKWQQLAERSRRHGVVRLAVFGSAAHETDFDPRFSDAEFRVESDADSGLEPFDPFSDPAEALRHILGRPVDLVASGTIQNLCLRAPVTRSRGVVHAV